MEPAQAALIALIVVIVLIVTLRSRASEKFAGTASPYNAAGRAQIHAGLNLRGAPPKGDSHLTQAAAAAAYSDCKPGSLGDIYSDFNRRVLSGEVANPHKADKVRNAEAIMWNDDDEYDRGVGDSEVASHCEGGNQGGLNFDNDAYLQGQVVDSRLAAHQNKFAQEVLPFSGRIGPVDTLDNENYVHKHGTSGFLSFAARSYDYEHADQITERGPEDYSANPRMLSAYNL